MESERFYKMALKPEFPDEMVFELDRKEDAPGGALFSAEGVDNITDQVHDFILARVGARYEATKQPSKRMRVKIKVDWDDDSPLAEGALPYYQADEDPTFPSIDGTHRYWAGRKSVRSNGSN